MENRIIIEYTPSLKTGPAARLIEMEEDERTGAMCVKDVMEFDLLDRQGGSRAAYIALHAFASSLRKGQSVEIRDEILGNPPFIKFTIERKRDILSAIEKISLGLHMMVCDLRGVRELDGELTKGEGERVFDGYRANPNLSQHPYLSHGC